MDYIGQGQSWPVDCDDGKASSEQGLQYSADTWIEQTIHFIEDHILLQQQQHGSSTCPTQVHLAGNSLGGYIAVHVAARRPDLIASLLLLNATPVWGLQLPGWSGTLPAPPVPRRIGRILFDTMRREDTMRTFLEATYMHASAWRDDAITDTNTDTDTNAASFLLSRIRAATETKGGHAAFASILWSGPATGGSSFWEQLARIAAAQQQERHCPIALVFGRDDPWCTPAIAQRMLRTTTSGTAAAARYWELQDVGHCPQHEAPQATALLVSEWLADCASASSHATETTPRKIQEAWGTTIVTERTAETMDVPWWKQMAAQML